MAAQYMPKTLAKTLSYIACHSPGDYGLFWDPDGTMPWKELYWALQEDPSLRFVRESHIRELTYLGIELPFTLEGKTLRLRDDVPVPDYPVADPLPERLYYACRRKHYGFVREHGLSPSSRPFLPVASDKELAMRLGRRRDPKPILLEIFTGKAGAEGTLFRRAGSELYLVEALPVAYLLFPPIREEELAPFTSKPKKEKAPAKPEPLLSPGSFFMDVHRFQEASPDKGTEGKGRKRSERGAKWKREARKDRGKRNA